MKTIFILFCTLLVVATAEAKRSDYDYANRAKLIEWVEQLRVMANTAKQHAIATDAKLVESQKQVAAGKDELAKASSQIIALEAWGKAEWQRAEDNARKAERLQRERDFFVNGSAFVLAALVTALAGPHLLKLLSFNPICGLAAVLALFGISLAASFAAVNLVLRLVT